MQPEIFTATVGFFGALGGAAATFILGRKQVAAQIQIAQQAAGAELLIAQQRLAAENRLADASYKAIERLLRQNEWELRSFEALKKHLPGFEDNELKKLLVAAGAVSFAEDGTGRELWGLLDRNAEKLAPRPATRAPLVAALSAPANAPSFGAALGPPVGIGPGMSLLPVTGFPAMPGSASPVAAPSFALAPRGGKS